MKIISYGGNTFSTLNVQAGVPNDLTGPDRRPVTIERAGGTPLSAGMAVGARPILVEFQVKPTFTIETTILTLMGTLDFENPNDRVLVGQLNDGTLVQCMAAVGSYTNRPGDRKSLLVTFFAADPTWRTIAATLTDQTGSSSPFSVAVTNAGQAITRPVYQGRWTVQRVTKTSTLGWQYRKQITLTNTLGQTIPPFPYLLNLGNTASLVTGSKALSSGNDLRILRDGEDLTRELVGWNETQTLCWVALPGMDIGEVLTLDMIYGNASAGSPPTWDSNDPDRPAFDHHAEAGTATGGSTTTLVRASATWEVNEWKFATAWMLTGASAGERHLVTSNTATTLTVVSTGNAIANTNRYILYQSSNSRWNYAVRQTDRKTDLRRGRWYSSSSRVQPNVISYDSPGSWHPELLLDNRDSFGQYRVSMVFVGAESDPFTILDARRTWEGNDHRVPNPGSADGVAITTPWPATALDWEYDFNNPNAMTKAWTGVRVSGAEDWAEATSDAVTTSGVVTRSVAALDLTVYGSVYQVAQGLWSVDDLEIGLDWRSDEGSATSGTTTTAGDATKVWATNQYAGGKIRMFSGDNAGRARAIASNTGTIITHSAFPKANADGDRFRVSNQLLLASLRDGDYLSLSLDSSGLVDSGFGSETAVYDFAPTLWVGGGPTADPSNQHRALIGYAAASRRLLLASTERVEINAARRLIRIARVVLADTSTGGSTTAISKTAAGWTVNAYQDMYLRITSGVAIGDYRKIRSNTSATINIYGTFSANISVATFEVISYPTTLTDPMVIVQYHDGTQWRRSADWLPLGLGAQTLYVEETNIGTLGLSVLSTPSYLG